MSGDPGTASRVARPGLFGAGAIYTIANISSAAVPFLLLPLLTRLLTEAEYGRIINFFLLVALCSATAGLSLHGAVGVRWFDQDKAQFPGFAATCVGIVLVSSIATAVGVLLLARVSGMTLGLSDAWLFCAALVAGANTILNMRLVLWQSQYRAFLAAGLQFSNSVLVMAFSLAGVLYFDMGSDGRIGGAVLASFLLAVVAAMLLYATRDAKGLPDWKSAKMALRFGVPLIPHAVAGVLIGNVDRLLVGVVVDESRVGLYGVAAQLGMSMSIFCDAYAKSYAPWLYDRLARCTPDADATVVGATWLSIPLFAILALAIGISIQLVGPMLVGPRFVDSLPLVWWFLLGWTFNGIYLSLAGFFFFTGRTECLSAVTLCTTAVGVVISWYLVKTVGLRGAAIGFASLQGFMCICAAIGVSRLRSMPWMNVRRGVRLALAEIR